MNSSAKIWTAQPFHHRARSVDPGRKHLAAEAFARGDGERVAKPAVGRLVDPHDVHAVGDMGGAQNLEIAQMQSEQDQGLSLDRFEMFQPVNRHAALRVDAVEHGKLGHQASEVPEPFLDLGFDLVG